MRHVAREGIQMNSNHWRDAVHMIVPVAYCDFVVLDRAWTAKARQVVGRLRKHHSIEMAKIFAVGELSKFWNEFDV